MSGSIAFKKIPANLRTHGVFAEFNPQKSGGTGNQRTLILGQMLTSGSAVAGIPFLATGLGDLNLACGVGSMVSLMYGQYIGQDSIGEVWIAPQADPAGAVVATGSVTFGGLCTTAGSAFVYIAGTLVAVPVAPGTTGALFAYSFALAVNADKDLPVTALVPANNGVVVLTAYNGGVIGNEIDVRANYQGAAGGETTPLGMTITTASLSGGAGTPSTAVSSCLSLLGDKTFDFIVCPYTDATTLNLLAAFLNDSVGRWSWQQQLYGGVFTAIRSTAGGLTTFGNARNEYTAAGIGFYDSPTPGWLWAADLAGACAVSLRADPGLPLQELVLNVLAPPIASRFPLSVRNTLLFDGISTFTVNDAGQVVTDQIVTFYQEDASGAPDNTWLYVETPYQVVDLTRDMRTFLQTTYSRKKLVADGTNIPGGSNMVTSQTILAAALARYKGYCDAGRAQNYAAFKAGARSENAGGGRVNLLLPFVLDSQLRQIAMSVNFIANS